MAITQISRIQHRRGLQQDLPQLASAELGWSVDTKRLYIGNGTLEEGAPATGVTEILTQYSDLTNILGTYTFKGEAATYTVQTGSSLLNPSLRSIQAKLDDIVNVRDFGAVGDGLVDDTNAINRAIQQIYKTGLSEIEQRARRTIYFPGGTYLISGTISIPTYARLVGDSSSATIKLTQGNHTIANIVDSQFHSGSSIGTGGAVAPMYIEIENIEFRNANTNVTSPLFNIDSANNIKLKNVKFFSADISGNYGNAVQILSSVSESSRIMFDGCIFSNIGNAISIIGNSVSSIRIFNSDFINITNNAIVMNTVSSLFSVGNYYYNLTNISDKDRAASFFGIGDNYENDIAGTSSSLSLGNLIATSARSTTLSSTNKAIFSILPNTSGRFTYEISTFQSSRFGSVTFGANGTQTQFFDEYTEVGSSTNANLYANVDYLTCSISSGFALFKYNLTQFI
jgi:hypothetical protein